MIFLLALSKASEPTVDKYLEVVTSLSRLRRSLITAIGMFKRCATLAQEWRPTLIFLIFDLSSNLLLDYTLVVL